MTFVKQSDGSYIEAGNDVSIISGKVVDDTEDFVILVSGVPPRVCEDYYTESECVAAGCYWYDGTCHKMPPGIVCSDYTTESACTAAKCYWYDDACHGTPEVAEFPWLPVLIAVGGVTAAIGIFFAIKR